MDRLNEALRDGIEELTGWKLSEMLAWLQSREKAA